jgi:hypothetical protein
MKMLAILYMSLSFFLVFLYLDMLFFYTRFSFNQDYSFYHEAFLKVMWHDVIPYVYFRIIVHTFIPSHLYNTFIRCHRRGLSTWTK